MAGWDRLENLVQEELRQAREEGKSTASITETARRAAAAAGEEAPLTELLAALVAAPVATLHSIA